MATKANPSSRGRIDVLDMARGVALFAMAVYHFTWDLEFFGYLPSGLTAEGGWRLFARAIASSFLFLVGVSLVLAHGRRIRWRSFWIRFAQIAAAALAITAATWFATPGGFIFFGILHQIAAASVLALPFLRLPALVTAAIGLLVLLLPGLFETAATNPRSLAWLGLAEQPPFSNDYVPIFPWFGVVLLGVAAARMATDQALWDRLRRLNDRLKRLSWLGFLGRHSLAVYLVHQPALIGLVWLFAQVAPPDPAMMFRSDCQRSCEVNGDAAFCARYCGCVLDELQAADLLDALSRGRSSDETVATVGAIVNQCSVSAAE